MNLGSMLLTAALLLSAQFAQSTGITGVPQTCNNEGEEVPTDAIGIKGMRCFKCMCKNGYVQCQKEGCPDQEGCFMLLDQDSNTCCGRVCKGCVHRGVQKPSGVEWRDPAQPCSVFRCEAGVVTETQTQCYTPCRDPQPPAPGQCCATCAGCQINGQEVQEDRNVTIPEDGCVQCRCLRGRLSCEKRACPVLQCSTTNQVTTPDHCCPRCKGSRTVMLPPRGGCIVGNKMMARSKDWTHDACTTCSCEEGGTAVCRRVACPVLECAPERQLPPPPGSCCPRCPDIEHVFAACTYNGKTYQDGETWQLGPCKSCVCRLGQARCAMQMCPQQNVPCPPNFKMVHKQGECCSKCVESDGVCTVFGDPHYRTFDGKFYSFQGSCKYQLASDCVTHSFSIRVTNDARATKTSSWTKTISLKIGELKVNLGQKLRVKVNGKRVQPPYKLHGKVSINKTVDSVLVETFIGVKVLWDGNSFLEISVPTKYKGKMCGLCGNFNHKTSDDFTMRRGAVAPETDADKFGTSWRVGGKKACTRPLEQLNREPQCQQAKVHQRSVHRCDPIRGHKFKDCHKKLNPMTYFKACIVDMCECPTGRCHCESFTAYAHECQRLGVRVRKWRKAVGCLSTSAGRRKRPPPIY